ncbi:hypothetical protein SCP_1900660 [Sparassis crispa]|uniref:Uncharacterized protein n=1 Tax=Sparassis crispa TaxID=139825 RepID=A0A401H6Z4_9APHY|nr:hypothetical protein SCP_1900660 [Sparassis crispa]GBE90217.1 hypothetical protein SCP_1900660 [Sparassis crispa]
MTTMSFSFTTTQTCLMTIRFNDVFRCLPLVFRTVNVKLRVIGTQPEPDRPGRPIIAIAGEVNDMATIVGWIRVTSDNQIQWHFNSGGHGDAIWRCVSPFGPAFRLRTTKMMLNTYICAIL